jgi:hypothetical protein
MNLYSRPSHRCIKIAALYTALFTNILKGWRMAGGAGKHIGKRDEGRGKQTVAGGGWREKQKSKTGRRVWGLGPLGSDHTNPLLSQHFTQFKPSKTALKAPFWGSNGFMASIVNHRGRTTPNHHHHIVFNNFSNPIQP